MSTNVANDSLRERMEARQQELFKRQVTAIVAWVNTFVARRNLKAQDLENDFSDGVLLINLLELSFHATLGAYKKSEECKLPFHKLDNVSLAFDFMRTHGVHLLSVDTNDIVKKNPKATLNVLWNVLRALTIRNLRMMTGQPVDGDDSKGKDQSDTVRQTLLNWTRQSFQSMGNVAPINDFWASFQDGIAFAAIVEKLAPGSIDVSKLDPKNAKENLALAFSVAQQQLGIPSLLQPEDFAPDRKPDEKSVENYVCMLVSAAQGKQKTDAQVAEMKQQMQAESSKKVEEAKLAAARAEAEKKRMEEDAGRLAAMQQEAVQRQQQLEETLSSTRTQSEVVAQQLQETKQQLEGYQQQMAELSHSLQQVRQREDAATSRAATLESKVQILNTEIAQLQSTLTETSEKLHAVETRDATHASKLQQSTSVLEQRDTQLSSLMAQVEELKSQNASLTARLNDADSKLSMREREVASAKKEIHKAKSSQMEMLSHFQSEMKERTFVNRSGSMSSDVNLNDLFLASIRENKGYKDFVNALKTKAGWLMKRRPGAGRKLFGTGYKKRYVELKGDSLLYYKEKGGKVQGKCLLKNYQKIAFELPANDPESDAVFGKRSSMVSVSGLNPAQLDRFVIRLVPKDHNAKATIMELCTIETNVSELREDVFEWIEEINTRIALIDYLSEMFNAGAAQKGSREIVEFVVDSKLTTLKIENKVQDIHRALHHFKESLIMRKNLHVVLVNVALSDPSVEILAEILKRNQTFESLDISRNLVTAKGAISLAEALKINRSLLHLNLSFNNLTEHGVKPLAESMRAHRKLQSLKLAATGINDIAALVVAANITPDMTFPSLDLSFNLIGDGACHAIADLCTTNPTLVSLQLDNNIIGNNGVEDIARAIASGKTKLTTINFSKNAISSEGVIALAAAMKTLNRPMSVDLSDNKLIGREGFAALLEIEAPLEFDLFKVARVDLNEP